MSWELEIIHKKIAGYHQTGAVLSATSQGGIIHPESDEEDVKELSDVLKVSIEKSTINGGVPYVSSGILANSKSIVWELYNGSGDNFLHGLFNLSSSLHGTGSCSPVFISLIII